MQEETVQKDNTLYLRLKSRIKLKGGTFTKKMYEDELKKVITPQIFEEICNNYISDAYMTSELQKSPEAMIELRKLYSKHVKKSQKVK